MRRIINPLPESESLPRAIEVMARADAIINALNYWELAPPHPEGHLDYVAPCLRAAEELIQEALDLVDEWSGSAPGSKARDAQFHAMSIVSRPKTFITVLAESNLDKVDLICSYQILLELLPEASASISLLKRAADKEAADTVSPDDGRAQQ